LRTKRAKETIRKSAIEIRKFGGVAAKRGL